MILCCGEALVDMIPVRTATGAEAFRPCPGGAVFNTAIALGRLGVRTGMLGGVSRDLFGQLLEDELRASGVDTSALVRSDRPTTLAFVALDRGQARYAFFDENSAGRMLRPADMPVLPDAVAALFFGGISLAGDPCAGAFEALLARSRAGRVVMIDPNIRPGFIDDAQACRARLGRMMREADIVKVSEDDLDWIQPEPVPLREKARRIAALGPRVVIVTHGADGARAFLAAGGEVRVGAEPVTVADTVGAGDTFNAGVLAWLSQRGCLRREALASLGTDALQSALRHAARAAAITVSRTGADPPRAADLASV